ncbi:MAG: hypothetical protein DCF19_13860 [Pseudanabaena frigida]|uniref:Antitoxin n=1 Tax=Pseudanabaena frigida TaxID=945775 RepID=A0A2W4W5N7_9CYAN|nr:MAG: hypothetical protein DCF19_13860 [Pseudanabaena frigida]
MSQVLTLELSDTDYAEIRQRAELAGVTITEWAISSLKEHKQITKSKLQNEAERQAARQRFRRHAGSINLGYATGADNESIDADLAKAYANELGAIA